MKTESTTTDKPVNKLLELKLKELDRLKRNALSKFIFGQVKDRETLLPYIGFHKADLPPDFRVSKETIGVIFAEEARRIEREESAEKFTAQAKGKEKEHVSEFTVEYPALPSLANNPKVKYLHWQNKGAWDLIRKLTTEKRRGVLLQAMGGYGKTYMLGAVLRHLWDTGWEPLTKNISPYPCVFITRASIIEQTERVLHDAFALKKFRQVFVTNIDQMRSTFGERFVKAETRVTWGQAEIVYRWYPQLKPGLIILDESQSVKNDESEQSKIMQAWVDREEDDPWSACVHSSATPFTRVSEAHTFAVSTGLEFHL